MRPLEGIRVLDLSRLLPGPFATLVLADLGATVDKVEDPELGDYLRHAPPHADGESVAFHGLNRGKRSIVLNLKSGAGATLFKRLVSNYDVVFDQFRPGVMDRLGIGHAALLEENPRLVICALTGYGQTGPLRDKAGHDLNYLARAGILGLMGPADRPPQLPSFQLADIGGGMWCLVAILAALRERDRTGKGSVLDIAMAEAVIPFATIPLARLFGGEMPARGAEYLTGGIAAYNTYFSKDGEAISLGALEPKFLARFCAGAGMDFDPMAIVPGEHQTAFKARYAEVFAPKTRAEWLRIGEEHDCCLEPVLRPGTSSSGATRTCERAAYSSKRAQVAPPSTNIVRPSPRAIWCRRARRRRRSGTHGRQSSPKLGFSTSEIATLRKDGVVK